MAKSIIGVFNSQNGKAEPGSSATGADAAATSGTGSGAPANAPRSVMILGKTLRFKGDLAADEDMVLLGHVHGSITHTSSLTIGFGGAVIGDVRAKVITVKGTVEGDLEASDSIIVSPSATVVGDLVAPRVSVLEGANFNGSVRMPRPVVVEASKGSPAANGLDGILSENSVDRLLGAT